jgi:hypothetical protein
MIDMATSYLFVVTLRAGETVSGILRDMEAQEAISHLENKYEDWDLIRITKASNRSANGRTETTNRCSLSVCTARP